MSDRLNGDLQSLSDDELSTLLEEAEAGTERFITAMQEKARRVRDGTQSKGVKNEPSPELERQFQKQEEALRREQRERQSAEFKLKQLKNALRQEGVSPDELLDGDEDLTPPEDTDVQPLFDFEKPDPMDWKVAGLVPEDHLTMLVGDGGTGKSFLALHMSLCIATGCPFLRRGVKRGRVLYVDHELDVDEQRRRTARVAEGMGLSVQSEALRGRLFYVAPTDPLGTNAHHDLVRSVVEERGIDVVVIDSLTMGAAGDVKDQADLIPIVQQIRQWPTTIAIDHVSHATATSRKASKARAFGSVFKRNAARSSLTLAQADTGGYVIQQEKSNFNAGDARVCYATEFSEDEVTFEWIDEADERAAGLLGELSSKDVTLAAVKEEYKPLGGAVLAENVVQWRDERDEVSSVKRKTVQNHFSALKRRGDVIGADGEGVLPASAEYETEAPF